MYNFAGFEDGGKHLEVKGYRVASRNNEKARKQILPQSLQRGMQPREVCIRLLTLRLIRELICVDLSH